MTYKLVAHHTMHHCGHLCNSCTVRTILVVVKALLEDFNHVLIDVMCECVLYVVIPDVITDVFTPNVSFLLSFAV